MNDFFLGLLTVLLATNQPVALSNLVAQTTGLQLPVPDASDPVEAELQRLIDEDDAAQDEVDQWIQESPATGLSESPLQQALLRGRVEKRLGQVRKAYEEFVERHPNHAGARLAFGSFLSDIQEEDQAREQWEKALQLDPKNPAAWNNLANYFGHNGPVAKAFGYYEKAIALDPSESVYCHNLATTIYMFRRDATNYYQLTLAEVLAKSMDLYRKALSLDPKNFILATEVAQTFYGLEPKSSGDVEADAKTRSDWAEKALEAWKYALGLARDDVERQGVILHQARVYMLADRFTQARAALESVTHEMYNATRGNLLKTIDKKSGSTDPEQASPRENP